MSYRMVIKGCEPLSMLVKECPLPVAGKGSGQIVFYETIAGHIKRWSEHGPFKFESATVFEENGSAPLCQLTDVDVSDFKALPQAPDTVDFVLFAATISWATAAPEMTEQAREEFESTALVLAVKHYGYKEGDALLKSILERRANDRYMVDWVEGAWIGYQAGRESVVVELPRPFMSGYTESGNCPATDLYSFDDVKSAIEAAGGTVKA